MWYDDWDVVLEVGWVSHSYDGHHDVLHDDQSYD